MKTQKSENYDHKEIESKWQKKWAKSEIYKSEDKSDKPKFYILDMFPYPSGEGLHVGHPKGYIATDTISRMKRMQGFNVLHPMGFDAFGLPAENYAIKTKTNPADAVAKNVIRFKKQLEIIGLDYDWSREINTTDPEYYRWTQWIFLKLFEKGLAYESYEPINWCPSCKTGLANEDVEDGKCERCSTVVEKKPMRQWVLKITDYAERLLSGIDDLDWPNSIKELQRNWIGRSEGAIIRFQVSGVSFQDIEVFTTRPDTLFGVTYIVVAPEYFSQKLNFKAENQKEIEKYIEEVKNKSEIDRTAENKEKTGIEIKGIKAINPANGEEVPIFVADYVLGDYGTGAVMAVPAHDARDFAFAKKYSLNVIRVINHTFSVESDDVPPEYKKSAIDYVKERMIGTGVCYTGNGPMINSGKFDGMDSEKAKKEITEFVKGKWVTKYKLRDWVFSRQRYWGEPIPLIHCEKCGVVAVPEKDLPVKLPKVDSYEPTGTGESPLASISEWVNVKCPKCGGKGKRETNTMPQWAGSSWYYLRYEDVNNKKALVDKQKEKYWSPVDFYVGGAEHATRHLIYARFWHKFLYDIGVVNYSEPFKKLQHVGLIMGEDGRKMSKRFGNVVNPDDMVNNVGADALRIYEMFMGPFDQQIAWNTDGIAGARRFVEKVWKLKSKVVSQKSAVVSQEVESLLHKTIKKVTEDIEAMKFNTAISSLMVLNNAFEKMEEIPKAEYEIFLKLIAPFAPHFTEELWTILGKEGSIHTSEWPKYDESKIRQASISIAIQIDGKIRDSFVLDRELQEDEIKKIALDRPDVKKWLTGREIQRIIYVKGKLLSIVLKK